MTRPAETRHPVPQKESIKERLRETTPQDILDYIERRWEKGISVLSGEPVVVPKGWHGEGKAGDYMVRYSDMLTAPLSGTSLSADTLVSWLRTQKFTFEVYGKRASSRDAAQALASSGESSGGEPLFRAVRISSVGTPVAIEFYDGSRSVKMRSLSGIGNKPQRTDQQNGEYRAIVAKLFAPFMLNDGRDMVKRLGMSSMYRRDLKLDDCAAAFTTIMGDMILDSRLGKNNRTTYDGIHVSVGTTHAVALAIFMADKRKVPLVFRAGAPTFGLAGIQDGMNYMANTQPEMLVHGPFTSGDFGQIMSEGTEQALLPQVHAYGTGKTYGTIRVYLNGGGPILNMLMRNAYEEQGVDFDAQIHIARASRIDNGPSEWGLLLSVPRIPSHH
jgi:hypothetical protein